jgi:hypothetical protein
MRRSPDALVARLRNRKGRIIGYSVLSAVCLALLAGHLFLVGRMTTGLVPRQGDDLLVSVVVGQQTIVAIAFLQTMSLVLAVGLGVAGAALIGELMVCTKNDLLVHLWDRVQALEQSQATGANRRQPQGPTSPDQPAADG